MIKNLKFNYLLFIFLFTIGISSNALENQWIKDLKSGCKFFNASPQPNETISFEGECNAKVATGKLTWLENNEINQIAQGKFQNGKQVGQGTYEYVKSGNIYEGNFIDGKRAGKGTFKWANGAVYEGDFIDGKRTGKGYIKWVSGSEYKGDFIDGKLSGKGKLVFANKVQYEGEFSGGLFNGRGEKTYADGAKYIGDFKDGLESGAGTFYRSDKSKLITNSIQGRPIGDAIAVLQDGTEIRGRFESGNFLPNSANPDHLKCEGLGFMSNSLEYANCRTQLLINNEQAMREERAYRQQMAEYQLRIEQERKEANIFLGLSALGAAANILAPPPLPPTSSQMFTFPKGKSMTCNTVGSMTNCF